MSTKKPQAPAANLRHGAFQKPKTTKKSTPPSTPRLTNAERSSFFARREAAKVLHSVLQGDARRRAVASIKSLVFSPSVRNKKATFALVCETLKHLSVIKEVLEIANVLNAKWKRQEELVYIVTYDILFGQATLLAGDAEKFLMLRKAALQSALARLLVRKKVSGIEELLLSNQTAVSKPRYVRVNTLKLDVDSAFRELSKQHEVNKDDLIQDLLVLPPQSDLHDHPLVKNGSVFLQGKASSMVAAALSPNPGWEVLDACSAPGNKTVHLAALMEGKGKIFACELHKQRVELLKDTIKRSGASNVEVLNRDFLEISTEDPLFSNVRAILLDPSCSGSGTTADRLDHLLPSYATQTDVFSDTHRIYKLSGFQKKALEHALSFPRVERVVYSTCSVNQAENEDVVNSVLPLASSLGFQLDTPFPQWTRRGLPVFEGSHHLLRTDQVEDMEGFFIALFVKKNADNSPGPLSEETIGKKHCCDGGKCKGDERGLLRAEKKIKKKKYGMPQLMIPMYLEGQICGGCNKVKMDQFGDHAVQCKSDPGIKHRHDTVRDGLHDILRRAGIAAKKEADIGLREGDNVLRPADILVYGWVNGQHTCLDLTGNSPLVGHNGGPFDRDKGLKMAVKKKYEKHETSCNKSGYEFIPFGFTSFGGLCEEAREFMKRVLKRLTFMIQKGVAAQIVSRLPENFVD
ncbi:25S rRNA (cytosine(2278)-C(5))-methyltransferase [Ranunculus cassubicifolius]